MATEEEEKKETEEEKLPPVVADDISFEKKLRQYGVVSPPVGSIVPYLGGYFTDESNGGFTMTMSEGTIAAVNELLNPDGWFVCDGSMLKDEQSLIFRKDGRYLPNLTDDRFLMGSTEFGEFGGDNEMAHGHMGTTTSSEGAHTHAIDPPNTESFAGSAHSHGTGSNIDSGGQSQNHTHIITGASHTHPVDNTLHTHPNVTTGGSSTGEADGADTPTGLGGPTSPTQGANQGHTHTYTRCDQTESAHKHYVNIAEFTSGAGSSHSHTITIGEGDSTYTENKPQYLSVLYIMRVK